MPVTKSVISKGIVMSFQTLSVNAESGDIPVHVEPLEALCLQIFLGESVPEVQSVDLIFCSEQTIQKLNRTCRGKDAVTDVLSYPFGDDDFLGEIYICTQRAKEQAEEYNFSLEEECCRLFVHGLFHLLGYDHLTDDERDEMEQKEQSYYLVN